MTLKEAHRILREKLGSFMIAMECWNHQWANGSRHSEARWRVWCVDRQHNFDAPELHQAVAAAIPDRQVDKDSRLAAVDAALEALPQSTREGA